MQNESKGYEYEVVGKCERSGRPIVAPKAWSNKITPRPRYYTCCCCGRKR